MINMVFGNLLILLNLLIFTKHVLAKKYNNKWLFPVTIILGAIILSAKSYPFMQLYGTFLMFVFYFLFIFLLFKGSITQKLFTIFIFTLIILVSEVLSANIMNLLFGLDYTDLNSLLYTLSLILSNAISYTLLRFTSNYFTVYSKMKLPKTVWLIFTLPVTTILFLINLNEYFETFRNNYFIAPIIIGLLIANFITIYIFFQTIQTIELKHEMRQMQDRYNTINTLYQNDFNFLHDTVWKLNDIYKALENENYENLRNQVDELSNKILKKFNVINTNSHIVSSCINYRLNEITINNIQVKTDIIYSDFSFLTIQAQNELFSILINNAVDSCLYSKCEKSNILLKSNVANNNIIIQCIFSYVEEYYEKNECSIKQLKRALIKTNAQIHSYFDKDDYCEIIIIFNV